MKQKLKALAAVLLTLVSILATSSPCYGRYINDSHVPLTDKVVQVAEKFSFKDFPTTTDILTIIMVESRFDEKARNGISKGLMQVNRGSYNIAANIEAGVSLLREYYKLLGSATAAIMAYNIGITAYLNGKRAPGYLAKYRKRHVHVSKAYEAKKVSDVAKRNNADDDDLDIWLSPALRVPGPAGGILVCLLGQAYSDPLCRREDREDD